MPAAGGGEEGRRKKEEGGGGRHRDRLIEFKKIRRKS